MRYGSPPSSRTRESSGTSPSRRNRNQMLSLSPSSRNAGITTTLPMSGRNMPMDRVSGSGTVMSSPRNSTTGEITLIPRPGLSMSQKTISARGVTNLLKRDFHADNPNEKWLSDITEFSIPVGKVYLSPVVNCFDGYVTS